MIGKSLSHYKILEELGRGGMGIVYKAEDTKLDRTVAIKVLPSAALTSEDDRARFYREAKAAAQLHHPHIASVFEIDEAVPSGAPHGTEPSPFIAMEFIEGSTLEAKIKDGPLKLEYAVRIVSEIASALEAAHKKDIVHRDIKSQNVMLTTKGEAKILDFGLAQTAASTKLTRMGSTMGTVAYMSPEQARGEEVDLRTDLWSLGVVLYEMITGRSPFPGDYEQAVVYEILNQDPEPLTSVRTGVPIELERIVNKCLMKDNVLRYQHADDLIADLRGIDLSKITRRTKAITPEASPVVPRPDWHLGAAFVLGVLIAAVTFLFIGPERDGAHFHATSIQRLTVEPQLEFWPSIHPNGDRVVYSVLSGGRFELFHRSIDGGPASRLVTGFERTQRTPVYSPDGTQIAFESGGSIYTVEALGGVPRPIALPRVGESQLRFPAWSPSGIELAVTTFDDSLFVVNLVTGERSLLAHMLEPHSPSFSHSGEFITVVSGNVHFANSADNIANSTIWVVRREDGSQIRLTSGSFMDMSPKWMPDDSGVLFSSTEGGAGDIRFQPISKAGILVGSTQRVTTGLGIHSFHISSDGSKIVAAQVDYSQNIWKSTVVQGITASASNATAVTQGNQIVEGVTISRDGKTLAYDSNIRGSAQIFTVPVEGGDPLQITSDSGPNFVYSWSPSGNELAYHRFDEGTRNVYTVSLDVFNVSPVSNLPVHERYPSWSPDENTLGFVRNDGARSDFILANREAGGSWITGETLVSSNDLYFNWSPRSDQIVYLDNNKIFIRDLKRRDSYLIVDDDDLILHSARWSPDARRVYYLASDAAGHDGIWSISASGGDSRQVVRFGEKIKGFEHIAIGDDAIYYTVKEIQSDIWVIDLGK